MPWLPSGYIKLYKTNQQQLDSCFSAALWMQYPYNMCDSHDIYGVKTMNRHDFGDPWTSLLLPHLHSSQRYSRSQKPEPGDKTHV